MKIKFDELAEAFDFVSSAPPCAHIAVLCKDTGKFYYKSEDGDLDEIPEEGADTDRYIDIPHKNDLDLGKNLAFDFVTKYLPTEMGTVENIFRRRGAYAAYKDILHEKGLVDKWYEYEHEIQTKALKQWCADNGIEI